MPGVTREAPWKCSKILIWFVGQIPISVQAEIWLLNSSNFVAEIHCTSCLPHLSRPATFLLCKLCIVGKTCHSHMVGSNAGEEKHSGNAGNDLEMVDVPHVFYLPEGRKWILVSNPFVIYQWLDLCLGIVYWKPLKSWLPWKIGRSCKFSGKLILGVQFHFVHSLVVF